jgi:hypothetical protein
MTTVYSNTYSITIGYNSGGTNCSGGGAGNNYSSGGGTNHGSGGGVNYGGNYDAVGSGDWAYGVDGKWYKVPPLSSISSNAVIWGPQIWNNEITTNVTSPSITSYTEINKQIISLTDKLTEKDKVIYQLTTEKENLIKEFRNREDAIYNKILSLIKSSMINNFNHIISFLEKKREEEKIIIQEVNNMNEMFDL